MPEASADIEHEKLSFEREKWLADHRLRELELRLKEVEARRARFWNPLAIAILGASIAAGGSAYVSLVNSRAALEVESVRAESARILEVVKTGDPDTAAKGLAFLLEAGLIQNPVTSASVGLYLKQRKPGEGFSLPLANSAASTLSDRRAKTDIHPLELQLENLAKLQGVTFSYVGDPEKRTHIGVIAQDVESVYPDLVSTTDSGMKAVNYLGLIAPLLEAIKEQQAEILLIKEDVTRNRHTTDGDRAGQPFGQPSALGASSSPSHAPSTLFRAMSE